jgi:hypothetical protein
MVNIDRIIMACIFTETSQVLRHKNIYAQKTVICFERVMGGSHIRQETEAFVTKNCNFHYKSGRRDHKPYDISLMYSKYVMKFVSSIIW